jgi:hypothetical protein
MNRLASLWLTVRHESTRAFGLAGTIGIILAILSASAVLIFGRGWERETDEIRQGTWRLVTDSRHDLPASRPAPMIGTQIRDFNTWFPPVLQNADDLRLVLNEANRTGLELDKGEYQFIKEAGSAFLNYEVVLPVKANYPSIRSFIAGVLNAAPHASLAELRMERPAADGKLLDTRIHFTFVYRGA